MRIIAHVDLDAFFASIEERDKPRLRGRPIVVGADPMDGKGRGVVSTANYAARKYGIRSAMPISKAWQLSEAARKRGEKPAAFLDVDMEKYIEVSGRIMTVLKRHVSHISPRGKAMVEAASVDEAYLDLSPLGSYGKAREAAQQIKDDIKKSERLTASVGVGSNKLIAKIASDREKPDGLTVVRPEDAEAFLAPLPVRVIPGVGPKTEELLARRGARTVGDAKRFTIEGLRDELRLGKWGADLYEKLRGRDESPLMAERVAKSVGHDVTFAHDMPIASARERKALTDALARIAGEVIKRLTGGGFKSFRSVSIVVRFAGFTTKTRAVTLEKPVAVEPGAAVGPAGALRTIEFQSLRLFMPFLDRRENPERKAIRLIGVRVERLA